MAKAMRFLYAPHSGFALDDICLANNRHLYIATHSLKEDLSKLQSIRRGSDRIGGI